MDVYRLHHVHLLHHAALFNTCSVPSLCRSSFFRIPKNTICAPKISISCHNVSNSCSRSTAYLQSPKHTYPFHIHLSPPISPHPASSPYWVLVNARNIYHPTPTPLYIYLLLPPADMDTDGFEIVTRKEKKRSLPRSGGHRNQSWSPPPDCMPDPKGQYSSEWPKRRSYEPNLCIKWQDQKELSAQSQKKIWQESLVKAKKKPWGAQKAIIRKGVHQSPEGGENHITVDYKTVDGVHIATWHHDLTDDEYQSFRQFEKP